MPTSHFSQQVHQPRPWGLTMEACSYHQEGSVEREPMFEKPLTPSDVGKLNRLVIPKQHAEKYFPLAGDSGEKGFLLSFEDEAGKAWRFRYSYWTSSQSYVLTKGWSRFVKEKKLDAGDIVLFERAMGEDRFYIGCRRRGSSGVAPAHSAAAHAPTLPWGQTFYSAAGNSYNASPATPSYMYMSSMQQDCFFHRGEQIGSMVQNVAAPKRLRLFGVNLECMPDQSEQDTVRSAQWFMDENPTHTERI